MGDALADAIAEALHAEFAGEEATDDDIAHIAADVAREWMEGKAVLSGRPYAVKACSHRDCHDARHTSLVRIPIDQEDTP